jgi:hypothetical protein
MKLTAGRSTAMVATGKPALLAWWERKARRESELPLRGAVRFAAGAIARDARDMFAFARIALAGVMILGFTGRIFVAAEGPTTALTTGEILWNSGEIFKIPGEIPARKARDVLALAGEAFAGVVVFGLTGRIFVAAEGGATATLLPLRLAARATSRWEFARRGISRWGVACGTLPVLLGHWGDACGTLAVLVGSFLASRASFPDLSGRSAAVMAAIAAVSVGRNGESIAFACVLFALTGKMFALTGEVVCGLSGEITFPVARRLTVARRLCRNVDCAAEQAGG